MIKQVRINGYKSLMDVEVELQMLTVIFGPNAAGKSNLFDALALLSRMLTERTLRDAFEGHRGTPIEAFYHGDRSIEELLKQKKVAFDMSVDVHLSTDAIQAVENRIKDMRSGYDKQNSSDDPRVGSEPGTVRKRINEKFLRYSLTVEILTDSGHLRIADEMLCALNQDGTVKKSRTPFIEKISDDKLILRLEGQAHPSHRDLGLDHTLISIPLYEPHYPHIAAFKEEVSRWRFYYLEPKRLMRSDNPLQDAPSLDSTGANLASFYNSLRARNRKQFDAINAALALLLPRVERMDVERTSQGELQLRVYENGVPFSSGVISEGTLRILGMLAITKGLIPASVIGFEEPENGVHPQRLPLIARMLREASARTQILINTHSSDLPEYFMPDSLINCRKQGRRSVFHSLKEDNLFAREKIHRGLADEDESPISQRIKRGDFGG